MKQPEVLNTALVLGVLSVTVFGFLMFRASVMWDVLGKRAIRASTTLQLAAAELLTKIRNDLNEVLRDHDEGRDDYLTRIQYQAPLADVRRYDAFVRAEQSARNAPDLIRSRIGGARVLAGGIFLGLLVSGVLAAFDEYIGLTPAHVALGVAIVILTVGVFYSFGFIGPYLTVDRAEKLAAQAVRANLALSIAVDARDGDDDGEEPDW